MVFRYNTFHHYSLLETNHFTLFDVISLNNIEKEITEIMYDHLFLF